MPTTRHTETPTAADPVVKRRFRTKQERRQTPGQVRHGESYGCIRLTNWDASDLARMVVRGTPVILEQ